MEPLTYEELAERVREYEYWLVRIADKPREYAELRAHFGREPDGDTAWTAFSKCGGFAQIALERFHPRLTVDMYKEHDYAERNSRDDYNRPLPGVPAPPSLATLVAVRSVPPAIDPASPDDRGRGSADR